MKQRLVSQPGVFTVKGTQGPESIRLITSRFYSEKGIIVFAHLSVTKQANTLTAAKLIIVHYVCLEDFAQAQKD